MTVEEREHDVEEGVRRLEVTGVTGAGDDRDFGWAAPRRLGGDGRGQ